MSRVYPEVPGAWLLVDPLSQLDPGLTTEEALERLTKPFEEF
jgi:hypothetical protein